MTLFPGLMTSLPGLSGLPRDTWFDDRVWPRKNQTGVPVVEAYDVGRRALLSSYFHDLSGPVWLSHHVSVDVQPIANSGLHSGVRLLPAGVLPDVGAESDASSVVRDRADGKRECRKVSGILWITDRI